MQWSDPKHFRGAFPGEIHLWLVPHIWDQEFLNAAKEILSAQEKRRIQEMKSKPVRNRFIISRYALRRLLAKECGELPEALQVGFLERDKPVLLEHSDLHFNISHTMDFSLLGICRSHALGLDVESMRRKSRFHVLAQRFFSKNEQDYFHNRGANSAAFFYIWTRKEAYLKAIGKGISVMLNKIDVLKDEANKQRPYSIKSISCEPDLAIAVSFPGKVAQIHAWLWSA